MTQQFVQSTMFNFDLRDHGIAVRRGHAMSHVVATDPTDGVEKFYLGINQGHDDSVSFLLVQINPQTGECRQFEAEAGCVGPWGMVASPDGHILVTSINGQVSVFDPRQSTLRTVAKADIWFWTITRGSDGKYYLGGSLGAKLFRFDLDTAVLEEIGSVDSEQNYLRTLVADDDGYIYGTIGFTAAQVIAYHVETGKVHKILPSKEEQPNGHRLGRGDDGEIYVECVTGSIYRVREGKAEAREAETWSGFAPLVLSDSRIIKYLDPDLVQIGEGDAAQVLPVEYEGAGTSIFHLAEGPNQCVYGSTLLPLYLFRYEPDSDAPECLGRGGMDNGEAYSFGHMDGRLYYATYAHGILMRYDPTQPWNPTPEWEGNPYQVAALGEGHCRPRAMEVDSQKRVWIGSHAEYGKFHGGLACYDTLSGELENNPVVIAHQSITSLASEPAGKVLYGATSTTRGSGVEPITKEGHIFAWDVEERRVLWQRVPVAGESNVNNLLYHDGKLYGATAPRGTFFIADARTGKVEKEIASTFGPAREESISWAPDGNIYGITWMALFRFRPDGTLEELLRHVDDEMARKYGGSVFHRGAAIINGRIYFSSGARVLSAALPISEPRP